MNDRTAAKQMRREYGENLCECCADCCNRQRISHDEPKMICIAYGRNLLWNGMEIACGLFNIPFRGLRPRRLPLGEVLCREKIIKPPVPEAEAQIQLSLT